MTIETPHPAPARPTVLLVDDSEDVQRLIRARLRTEDVELVSARNGVEGIAEARRLLPAVVLLDLEMPTMDGFEVLRLLKEDSVTVQIPVIVLSGLASTHDKVTAFELGAADYVTKPFDPVELRVRVRAALRLHHLLQMLAQRAQIDGLSGLWNRAFFDRRSEEEFARSSRHARPLSVAMFDIDHFKSINDTFGHPAGDAVLQGFARLLQRECRQTDVACRYGGEEFALVMPDTGPDDARAVCDRIRAALEAVPWGRHPERNVTVSCGVCGFSTTPSLSREAWIDAADRNLYSAKRSGRNRVVASDPGAGSALPAGTAG